MYGNIFHIIVGYAPEIVNKQFLANVARAYEKLREDHIKSVGELFRDVPWKAKDRVGNTLLHIALNSHGADYVRCARQLFEFDPTFKNEVNQSGETPLHVLLSNQSFDQLVTEDTSIIDDLEFMTNKMDNVVADINGLTPILRAAKEKRLHLLQMMWKKERLMGVDPPKELDRNDNNILHLLADMEVTDPIQTREFLFSKMPCWCRVGLRQVNNDGDTPIHLAVKNTNSQLAHIFTEYMFHQLSLVVKNEVAETYDNDDNSPPRLNFRGLIEPLVESLVQNVTDILIGFEDLAGVCNNDGNTVMHLAILKGDLQLAQMINQHAMRDSSLIEQVSSIGDSNGNTQLHLAILEGGFQYVHTITQQVTPNSSWMETAARIPNRDGDTPLHLAIRQNDYQLAQFIIEHTIKNSSQPQLVAGICDAQGNTPLHFAILKSKFRIARDLIESAIETKCLDKLLELRNNKDETPNDLIGSAHHLPYEFEDFLWRKPQVVEAMLGVRSLSGVSTKTINEYSNTIGVTAALFATITFTAAFTVPGGSKDDNGTPILMKKAAFQVFMVADTLAMCLSMIVLFGLLWIMTIGNKKHQVVLLDLTIFLLEGAFYATILTFMTGLYATVFPVSHWIAILTCVLCSLLILLMHKRFIGRLIPFFIQVYVGFRKAYSWIRESCGCIKYFHHESNQNNEETSGIVGQANELTGTTSNIEETSRNDGQDNEQTGTTSKKEETSMNDGEANEQTSTTSNNEEKSSNDGQADEQTEQTEIVIDRPSV